MFEEEERNNKKGAKDNTGSAAKPIVNHQIDSDEAVLKIHLEKKAGAAGAMVHRLNHQCTMRLPIIIKLSLHFEGDARIPKF